MLRRWLARRRERQIWRTAFRVLRTLDELDRLSTLVAACSFSQDLLANKNDLAVRITIACHGLAEMAADNQWDPDRLNRLMLRGADRCA